MKIYTKKGDSGATLLIGSKKRVLKSKPVFEVLGGIDEVNACIGCATATLSGVVEKKILEGIQADLFCLGSLVAGAKVAPSEKEIWVSRVGKIEKEIDSYSKQLPALSTFILPGGSVPASYLHLARVKTRALERHLVSYIIKGRNKRLGFVLPYVNRLSDFLFVFARYINKKHNIGDKVWKINK